MISERRYRFYYANASFRYSDPRGRGVHIRQFIDHSIKLGHQVWMEPDCEHPNVYALPKNRIQRLAVLRNMQMVYVRLQEKPADACRFSVSPYRQLLRNPLNVWEFNTSPEFCLLMGGDQNSLNTIIKRFQYLGKGCDLAVCVSKKLSDFVMEELKIPHTLVAPNGSDPDLFHGKKITPNEEVTNKERLDVVWIGSADLKWHNFSILQEAIKVLKNRGQSNRFRFHIIGANFPHLNMADDTTHYYGSMPYEELPACLAKMDVGLVLYNPGPADYNSPLKLFDYLASELAVISSQQPQTLEILRSINGEDCILLSNDPGEFADRLMFFEENRERVRELGTLGRKLIIEKYNWNRTVSEIHSKISQIL